MSSSREGLRHQRRHLHVVLQRGPQRAFHPTRKNRRDPHSGTSLVLPALRFLVTMFLFFAQGSPFDVTVRPPPSSRPHSGTFHCCAFCSGGGSKDARCACGGRMPGGYMGCGHSHGGHPGRKHWSCCGNPLRKSFCSRPVSIMYQFTI